jgi:hypothetical protein
MNFPHIDWNNISTDKGAGDCNYEFLESIRDCFLDQHITEPTRGRGETKPSTIDLLFSNEEGMVDNIDISPPLGKSIHSLISFVFNIYVENQNTSKIRYKYDKADFESMRDILNIDWRTILLNKDIDEQWTVFVSKINDAIDKCVPNIKINSNTDIKSDKNCPLTRKARAKIKKKNRDYGTD